MADRRELPGVTKRRDLLSRRLALGLAIGSTGFLSMPRRMLAQDTGKTGIEDPLTGETFIGVADDGVTRNVWLTGPAVEDVTTVTGEVASVSLELGPKVSGLVTFPDGVELTFSADPASGVAGLYEIGPVSDFLLTGSGTSGQAIQLQVSGALADGTRLLAGIIGAEGTAYPVALFASPDASGELRVIASHQGTIVGGRRIVQGAVRGSGFVTTSQPSAPLIDPDPELWIDPDPAPWVDPDPQP
jgi:hypothetical protein